MSSNIAVPLDVLGAYVWGLAVLSLFLPVMMWLVSMLAQSCGRAVDEKRGSRGGLTGWTVPFGALVLYVSYLLGRVILQVPGSPITDTAPPGIAASTWAKLPLLAPAATLFLVLVALQDAGRGLISMERLTSRKVVPGTKWIPTPKKEPVDLGWPLDLVHKQDCQARVAQTTIWKIYAKAPYAAMVCALIATSDAQYHRRWSATLAPGSSGLTATIVVLGALAVLSLILASGETMIPSRVRMQVDILRCLAEDPVETWCMGMSDPIGSHRAALNRIAKHLRSQARRLEYRTSVPPNAAILRGAARAIDEFTGGRQSLTSELPGRLRDILSHTAAILAGQKSPATLRALAIMVEVFDASGRPTPETATPVAGPLFRAGSAISRTVGQLSEFTKALLVFVMLAVFAVLWMRGQTGLSGLPDWKP